MIDFKKIQSTSLKKQEELQAKVIAKNKAHEDYIKSLWNKNVENIIGRLNRKIEKAANKGDMYIRISVNKYHNFIRKYYQNLGFKVEEINEGTLLSPVEYMYISWRTDSYSYGD